MKTQIAAEFKIGERIKTHDGYIKVMAFADGYYMARHKGCIPFCASPKEMRHLVKQEQAKIKHL